MILKSNFPAPPPIKFILIALTLALSFRAKDYHSKDESLKK
jgi:hypothetical protein